MEQIKRIPTQLIVKEFLITFEYVTWKGNHRKLIREQLNT